MEENRLGLISWPSNERTLELVLAGGKPVRSELRLSRPCRDLLGAGRATRGDPRSERTRGFSF